MITYQNPINYYYLAIIAFNFIYLIIMSTLVLLMHKKNKINRYLKTITTPLIYFSLGLIFPSIVHIITHLDGVFVVNIPVDVFYMMGYAVYTFTWLMGIRLYLNKTIRIAPQEQKRFNIFIYVLLIFSIISFIFSLFIGFYPSLAQTMKRTVFLMIFAGLGIGISILFLIFMRILTHERNNNPSKIIKARIDLLIRVLIIQIILGLIFFMLSTLVIMYPQYRNLLNLVFFGISDTLSMISVVLLYWSIDIPNYIRRKYNISPSRFNAIKEL